MKRIAWILLFAFLLAMILRMFVFESFRVVSNAMEYDQVPGNRLLVEKWTHGARLPQSLKWPFGNEASFWAFSDKIIRTPAFLSLSHNDLVLFNNPRSSTEIPINQRPVLLSRCVALPGETVELDGYHLYVNDVEQQRSVDALFCFRFSPSRKAQVEKLVNKKLKEREFYEKKDTDFVFLANFEYIRLVNDGDLKGDLLKPYVSSFDTGKTFVPYKGFQITLNERSFEQWGSLINAFEGVSLVQLGNGTYEVNGQSTTFYVFKQDFFWVLNDHQGYLNDSRTIGLIPSSHLIGRAFLVLFSPKDRRFLQII